MATVFDALSHEYMQFRTWAAHVSFKEETFWDDEAEDHWMPLEAAFRAVLTTSEIAAWNDDVYTIMLYAIARNDETERLSDETTQYPITLLALAERAVHAAENGAKWQLAAALATLLSPNPRVESLLLQFAHDDDEYVRRRAMMALADFGSAQALTLVPAAWQSGIKSQQRAALHVLAKLQSPLLSEYLKEAESDSHQ